MYGGLNMIDLDQYRGYGDGHSESIFIAALRDDCLSVIRYVKQNNDIDMVDQRGQSLLHLAVRSKSKHVVHLLLDYGINANLQDRYGETPLHIATQMGSIDIVHTLLAYGVDINAKNKKDERPIHKACLKGDFDCVKALVEARVDLHVFDEYNVSVVQKAVKSKSLKLVQYVIDQGAIINSVDIDKHTTMHYAAEFGTTQIVDYLFQQGLTGYAKTTYLLTPLHLAVKHPDSEMVKLFIEQGSTSYDKSSFNESPYDIAVQYGQYEAVELFNQLKNDETYQQQLKQCELCLAIIKNEFDLASALIQRVDVNQPDAFNNTALFYALMNEETYLVKKLLEHGASTESINQHGLDAIYFAALLKNKSLFEMLLPHSKTIDKPYFGFTIEVYLNYVKAFDLLEVLKNA
jgi:ankyrin repeat protein